MHYRLLGALVLVALLAAPAGARAADDVPPGGYFVDDDGSTHEGAINALAAAGFTQGCDPDATRYCPEEVVTRGQMASFLARVLALADARRAPFDDIAGNAHRDSIGRVFAAGITKGCTETSFCPDLGITREQAASFLYRAFAFPATDARPFSDVGAVHAEAVSALWGAGVTQGCDAQSPRLFCPRQLVTRAEMASFLVRSLGMEEISSPPGAAGVVYLTFDDGPHPTWTPQVLDVLARHGAVGTFFVIGSSAGAYPENVRDITAAGHAVENHTWSHRDLTQISDGEVLSELQRTSDVVESITGTAPCAMRPPGGHVDSRVTSLAASLGLSTVMWDIDPQDWRRPGSSFIAEHIISRVGDGSIILLHDGGIDRSQTVAALDTVVGELKARGFGFGRLCD